MLRMSFNNLISLFVVAEPISAWFSYVAHIDKESDDLGKGKEHLF